MNKILTVIFAFILSLLVGCQNAGSGSLDTTRLTKVEMPDVTDEQREKIPITYEAPSVEDGLSALPFEMKLPEKLPFEAKPFLPPTINDMSHNGENLMVEFKTSSKDNSVKPIILMITAINSEAEMDYSNSEELKLKHKVTAYYTNKSLFFYEKGITYTITYINEGLSKEQHKKDLINLANQMI
ncbi:hypothetical protein [Mesobacillus harenae]|uniref:hypothetical protein n=1 Tax=Mesobacillus harenae TaxID=2213203 RepID=UPI00157FF0AC|nr:hypothetical protein [Mesobacillus harenae]